MGIRAFLLAYGERKKVCLILVKGMSVLLARIIK